MKNNKFLIPAVIIVVVAILGGVYLFLAAKKSNAPQTTNTTQEQEIKKLSPSDIGLTLKPRSDGKAVILTVSKLDKIKTIEYEASYDAEETVEGETSVVPQGVTNSPVEVKPGESEITREVVLGTCSRNVCRYHKVKSPVKFILKITFTDGTVGSVEDSINIAS